MIVSMRKRSATITLGLGFMTLMGVGACGEPEPERPDYVAVCEDNQSVRVPDEECNQDGSGHVIMANRHWAHYPSSVKAPAVGHVGTGRVTPPAGASVGRVPASGGFGSHAGTVAG